MSVMEVGTFKQTNAQAKHPDVTANYKIQWHVGLISETLKRIKISSKNDVQLIIFIDVDLYEPTKEILEYFSRFLKPGDLIYFDEAFDPWNEGLAFLEVESKLPKFISIGHTGSALLLEIEKPNKLVL